MGEDQIEVDLTELCELVDELREDVTQMATAMSSYGHVLAQVIRALDAADIPVTGIKTPTLQ